MSTKVRTIVVTVAVNAAMWSALAYQAWFITQA